MPGLENESKLVRLALNGEEYGQDQVVERTVESQSRPEPNT